MPFMDNVDRRICRQIDVIVELAGRLVPGARVGEHHFAGRLNHGGKSDALVLPLRIVIGYVQVIPSADIFIVVAVMNLGVAVDFGRVVLKTVCFGEVQDPGAGRTEICLDIFQMMGVV